jgi:hypothetical protein
MLVSFRRMDSMKSSWLIACAMVVGCGSLLLSKTTLAQAPPAAPYQQFRPPVPGQPAVAPPQNAMPQSPAPQYPAPQQYRPPVGGPVNQQPTRTPQAMAANTQATAANPQAAAPPTISQNDRTAALILIKNTLIAVNQGNLTGNFTVLRDLASPGFRNRNSAGDLATIFQNLKQKKVDLSPVVVLDPLIAPPQVTKEGLLLIEGYFPSNPLRINFKLGYIKSETGGWMIDAVSVGVSPAEATSSNQPRQAAPTQAQPAAEQRRPG